MLGGGGTSYAGERNAMGVFAEVSVPVADTVEVRAAARADDYDDVGGLRAWRLGAEYRPIEIVTLRGSWSVGDKAPSMNHLHSTCGAGPPICPLRTAFGAGYAAQLRHGELPAGEAAHER